MSDYKVTVTGKTETALENMPDPNPFESNNYVDTMTNYQDFVDGQGITMQDAFGPHNGLTEPRNHTDENDDYRIELQIVAPRP